MNAETISTELIQELKNICGKANVFFDEESLNHYGHDETEKLLDKKIDHDYTERPGEHNWTYWNNSVKYQMLFFHQFFIDNKVLN